MKIQPIIQTSWRDVRASRCSGINPHQAAGTLALVTRLLARLASMPVALAATPMTLRKPTPSGAQSVAFSQQIIAAPQLHLALTLALAGAAPPGMRQVERHERIERQVERILAHESPVLAAALPVREQLVARMAARAERTESGERATYGPPTRPGGPPQTPAWSTVAAMSMVLPRPPAMPVPPTNGSQVPAHDAPWQSGTTPVYAPPHDAPWQSGIAPVYAPPAPTPASPIDVARLTDHVINAIDRRMLAARERLGR